jgi:sugar/nucleoside kinase (ribokinase family)
MKYNALFIGLTTIDIQYFVNEFPETNTKIKTNPPDILVGGPACNASVAFSLLNKGTYLATVVGGNSFSSFIKRDFNSNNIYVFDIGSGQDIEPVVASVVTSKNGDRNIFTHNPSEILTNTNIAKVFTYVKPEIVLLDGFYPEFSIACAKFARNLGIPVVIDCGSWKPQYKKLLPHADIAICSADFYPPKCKGSTQVFNYVKSLGVKQIAISRGNKNILLQNAEDFCEITIRKLKVADTLGAGDFLHGAFCYYYLEEKNIKYALRKASEMATFSCQYKGTREWMKFWK